MRHRILNWYADLALRRPFVLVAIAAVLCAISASLLPRITIVTARSKQIRASHPLQVRQKKFTDDFGGLEALIILARGDDAQKTRTFVDGLRRSLLVEKDEVRAVFHRLDLSRLGSKALLYFPVSALLGLRDALARPDFQPAELGRIDGLQAAMSYLDQQLARALRGEGPEAHKALPISAMTPLLEGLRHVFDEVGRWIDEPARKALTLVDKLMKERLGRSRAGADDLGYLSGKDGRTYLLFVYPTRLEDSSENQLSFTERVRKVIAREKQAALAAGTVPLSFEIGLTGMAASVADEFATIQADMTWVSLAAFLGITLLLLISYRFSMVRILIAMTPIMLGTLWCFGFASIAVGYLSLLSSVFSAVLFGLGDDFGIHLLARFEEEWARTGDPRRATRIAIVETGPGVITGACTTAIAFYTTLLVELDAFGELGLIAGTGLVLVALAAFLMLPPLFLLWAHVRERRAKKKGLPAAPAPSGSGERFARVLRGKVLRYPKVVIALAAVATVFFFVRSPGIPFDYNYLNLLPEGMESTRYHHRLVETSDFSSEFSGASAASFAELREKAAALGKLGTVGRVESIAPLVALARAGEISGPAVDRAFLAEPKSREEALALLLPADQPKKVELVRMISPKLAALPDHAATPKPFDAPAFDRALLGLGERMERLLESAPPSVTKEIGSALRALAALRKKLSKRPAEAAARVGALEREVFARLGDALRFLRRAAGPVSEVTPADLLEVGGGILERLVGKSGRLALYAFPNGPVWERDFLGRFVADTHGVDPEMTGFPVGFYYFSEKIQSGFRQATLYAALAIFLLLLLEFRSIFYALLAAVPLCIGAATMLGLMDLFGIKYNPANIVALPLVLGMGVEYGVETVHRFAESDGLDVSNVLGTTSRAILVAGLTTVCGLGTMSVASHQGIAGLGIILVCGIGGCLLASVLVLPSLLILLARSRQRRRAG